VHFSHLWNDGIPEAGPGEVVVLTGGDREVFEGETVHFDWETPGQDGYNFRARAVATYQPGTDESGLAIGPIALGHDPPLEIGGYTNGPFTSGSPKDRRTDRRCRWPSTARPTRAGCRTIGHALPPRLPTVHHQ
jgi:hypothetical protein